MWFVPLTPALRRSRQEEGQEFNVNLSYILATGDLTQETEQW